MKDEGLCERSVEMTEWAHHTWFGDSPTLPIRAQYHPCICKGAACKECTVDKSRKYICDICWAEERFQIEDGLSGAARSQQCADGAATDPNRESWQNALRPFPG